MTSRLPSGNPCDFEHSQPFTAVSSYACSNLNEGRIQAVERFTHLDLQSNSEKTRAASLPKPERQEPSPPETKRRLSRFINKAAHHAANRFGRGTSGIFTK